MDRNLFSDDIRRFFEYGCSLRRGGALPQFADFDLMALHPLSSNVILVDITPETGRYLNRFVGTGVVALFGETTGRYVDEVDLGGYKSELLGLYDSVARTGVPQWSLALVIRNEVLCGVYDYPLRFSYERLVLPLTDSDGRITHLTAMILGREVDYAGAGIVHEPLHWPDPAGEVAGVG